MLLSQSSGKAIAQLLKVPELEAEMERAIEQVETAIASQRKLEEERRGASATPKVPREELEKRPFESSKAAKDDILKKSD